MFNDDNFLGGLDWLYEALVHIAFTRQIYSMSISILIPMGRVVHLGLENRQHWKAEYCARCYARVPCWRWPAEAYEAESEKET